MQLILISGLSGSGKSIALTVLEDCGFYCVDNLPAQLLPNIAGYLDRAGHARIAISVDVRSSGTLDQLPQIITQIKEQGFDLRLLFLEAKTDTLVKRFSETRRRHPLSSDQFTLKECIQLERDLLEPVGDLGHRIDTSDLNPNTLRAWIKEFVDFDRSRLTLLFQSFGFKHGIPLDADFVFDVRCLPNPHYDPVLRPLTGKDAAVAAFLESDASVQKMLGDIRRFVEDWLPCFIRDNRNYLTVALGCTGGQHRSVYFAEKLMEHFHTDGQQTMVRHRELS
ncbi:glmZ(sRNA)-inactivating NTPase [Sulfuricella sp. T08]|uniref:RNase adapter RapZ n=1 Tax=Sulfuricella sp. T08 TaxID=1632857 RepID=UPI0006179C09|nr:RNase adapter RapZ [Sulfuricella sp. T08]GAO35910.1 glmZ(sRNA)-inactivating NTPase [Sulfuricella sp. T08]